VKILLVDDDAAVLDMMSRMLQHRGHLVHTCDTPFGVSAQIVRDPPDLVVLDVMMPGMSGIDVCRQLRQDAGTKALPIILLTARAQEGDVEVGFGAGADDYIVKPFSPRELVSRVEAVLARMRT